MPTPLWSLLYSTIIEYDGTMFKCPDFQGILIIKVSILRQWPIIKLRIWYNWHFWWDGKLFAIPYIDIYRLMIGTNSYSTLTLYCSFEVKSKPYT